jgi:RND family efflux transporter MFP subunit
MTGGAGEGREQPNWYTPVLDMGSGVNDQLSSDLASLRIDRNAPSGGGAKRALFAVVLLGALGTAGWMAYPRVKAQVFKTEVGTTEVSLLSPVQSSVQVTATGYIVPQVTSKVGPHDTGRLARVLVKEGDTVKAGQVLAEMETLDQRSAVAAAASRVAVSQARVETSRATLAETKQKVSRERALVEHGAEGKSVLDDLVAQQTSLEQQVKAAEAEVAAADAERSTLGVNLRQRTVVAPIDGTVVAKPMKPGEIASPGDTGAIVELADFRSLLAEVDVPENRLSSVKVGGPADIILDAYPDRHFRGEVLELGKRVDRSKATLVVKVKFVDAMDGVLPEMSARVSFLSAPVSDEALKAPPKKVVAAEAVVDRGGHKVLFVVGDDGAVRSVPVTIGAATGGSVELLSGPASGTHVVASPPPELVDGVKIKEKGS